MTSSLTASSAFGTGDDRKGGKSSVRVISSSSGGGSDDNNNSKCCDSKKNVALEKIARSNTVGMNSSSSDQKNGTMGLEGQNISLHDRSLSMSEISEGTQSSKGDSGSSSYSGDTTTTSDILVSDRNTSFDECETEDQSDSSSASSTAAVMSGLGSKEQNNLHANIMVKESIGDRKRRHEEREKTSLEMDFQLNYQEVFLASNIPQLIATQTGRIAICKLNMEYVSK